MSGDETFVVGTTEGRIAGWSRGTGLDLLILHGGPGMSDYADLLRDETRAWHAVHHQQRGLAPSTTAGPFTVARHVDDAIAVLDHLGIERVVVLGHSWGGRLAVHLALAQPRRVTGLVLVDSLGVNGDGGGPALGAELHRRLAPARRAAWDAVAARLVTPGATDEDARESLHLLWPGYFADPDRAPAFPAEFRVSLACNVETAASALQTAADGSLAERLRSLDVPAAVLVGERSPMPGAVGAGIASLIPGAHLSVVPAAGHLVWHEQPGSVARALAHVAESARA